MTTGRYRSECSCRIAIELHRADSAPKCPQCNAPVQWTFLRATYVAPPPDSGTRKSPPDRARGDEPRSSSGSPRADPPDGRDVARYAV